MKKMLPAAIAIGTFVAFDLATVAVHGAQRGGGAPETCWVSKTKGGVYNPPMRPL